MAKVRPDRVGKELEAIITAYSLKAREAMEDVATECGEQCATKLRAVSPKRKGRGKHYANGWRSKRLVYGKGKNYYATTVYNATKPGLAHLLEKGHNGAKADGTAYFVPPQVHIKPVEQEYASIYVQKTKERLEQID